MADKAGQAEIRGIQIDRNARNYFEEALIFKKEVSVVATASREIRWYSKSSGYLTHSAPATMKVAEGARPFVLDTSWTRNTNYVKKYFVESRIITMEDESDNEVKVFTDTVRDLTEAVAYDVDKDIWDVASESQSPVNINSVTATAAWDAASGQDPVEDIEEAKQKIREQTKRPLTSGALYVSAKGAKDLAVWLSANSNIPQVASKVVEGGMLLTMSDLRVVVSENVTADYAMVGDLKQAVEWREFKPLQTAIINEEGIGRKVRVWTHGVAVLVRPKYLALISNTEA